MRDQIWDHINSLKFPGFNLSAELPWSNSGQPLYLKNLKTIYVDSDVTTNNTLITLMNGVEIVQEITSVKVYLATDAKKLPNIYETVVSGIKQAKDSAAITGVNQRQVDVIKTYDNDVMITEFEFRFTTTK